MTPFLRVCTMLEDIFDVPASRVDETDNLKVDWGFDEREMQVFRQEFYNEFNYDPPEDAETIAEFLA